MPKLSCFVITYSIVLMALFITFSYLITTVNPPKLKPDTDRARKFGMLEDEFSYPELLPIDKEKFGYGLEKVDYDMIVIKPEDFSSTCTEIPTSILETNETDSKNNKTNCTRIQKGVEMATEPMKISVKGLRRSISENKNLDTHRSLLLKIINYGGDPQVELRIVTEKNKNGFIRYGSSGSGAKQKTNITSISDADYNNNNRDLIDLNENETIFIKINSFKINDSIEYEALEVFRDNKTGANESEINMKSDDEGKLSVTFSKKESNNDYKNKSNHDVEMTSKLVLTTENTDLNMSYLMPPVANNTTEKDEVTNKMQNSTKNTSEKTILKVKGDLKERIDKSNPSANLVGLLTPEATATLPNNYHFIT